MDQSIMALCESLSSLLNHAESSSRELADAVSQRPIHLGNHLTRTPLPPSLPVRLLLTASGFSQIWPGPRSCRSWSTGRRRRPLSDLVHL